MVSGSQLYVAKLAQMCPAAPSSAQQHKTAPSCDPSQNPGQNPGRNLDQNPGRNLGRKEPLGA